MNGLLGGRVWLEDVSLWRVYLVWGAIFLSSSLLSCLCLCLSSSLPLSLLSCFPYPAPHSVFPCLLAALRGTALVYIAFLLWCSASQRPTTMDPAGHGLKPRGPWAKNQYFLQVMYLRYLAAAESWQIHLSCELYLYPGLVGEKSVSLLKIVL